MLDCGSGTLSGYKNSAAGKKYKNQLIAIRAVAANGFFHGL
ncbi:hypothetical protein WG906_11835 [Pedobacter sp. P351]